MVVEDVDDITEGSNGGGSVIIKGRSTSASRRERKEKREGTGGGGAREPLFCSSPFCISFSPSPVPFLLPSSLIVVFLSVDASEKDDEQEQGGSRAGRGKRECTLGRRWWRGWRGDLAATRTDRQAYRHTDISTNARTHAHLHARTHIHTHTFTHTHVMRVLGTLETHSVSQASMAVSGMGHS